MAGLSVVDIMNLPPVERRILRLVMRAVSMTYTQLRDAVATMPAEQQINDSKLNDTLNHLTQDHWLVAAADGQQTAYHASEIHRTRSHNPSLWNKLETPVNTLDACPPTSGGKRKLPTRIWDCLLDDDSAAEQ